MELTDRINYINTFNQEGIALTMQAPPRYDEALAKHQEAAQLALDENLNPDYRAFSTANIGYALRRKGEPREEVVDLLVNTFVETVSRMQTWTAADSSRQDSYAGSARLLEELALARKHAQATKEELLVARSDLDMAIDFYKGAQKNTGAEIIPVPQLNSRLWRTLGVASTVATDLAKHAPRERRTYLNEAVSYAQQELDARLEAGEKSFNLANAYHTLAVAQTELANRDKEMYLAAKENLQLAKSNAQAAGNQMAFSVMTMREAWLEYKRSPLNKKAIGNLVQTVLEQQQQELMRWDKSVKAGVQPKMLKLAEHLGGACQEQILNLYSA